MGKSGNISHKVAIGYSGLGRTDKIKTLEINWTSSHSWSTNCLLQKGMGRCGTLYASSLTSALV